MYSNAFLYPWVKDMIPLLCLWSARDPHAALGGWSKAGLGWAELSFPACPPAAGDWGATAWTSCQPAHPRKPNSKRDLGAHQKSRELGTVNRRNPKVNLKRCWDIGLVRTPALFCWLCVAVWVWKYSVFSLKVQHCLSCKRRQSMGSSCVGKCLQQHTNSQRAEHSGQNLPRQRWTGKLS